MKSPILIAERFEPKAGFLEVVRCDGGNHTGEACGCW